MFLHEVRSVSVCAMNVPNYYARNLEVSRSVRQDNQMGCYVVELGRPIALVGDFS